MGGREREKGEGRGIKKDTERDRGTPRKGPGEGGGDGRAGDRRPASGGPAPLEPGGGRARLGLSAATERWSSARGTARRTGALREIINKCTESLIINNSIATVHTRPINENYTGEGQG